jgi:hypothetical protein
LSPSTGMPGHLFPEGYDRPVRRLAGGTMPQRRSGTGGGDARPDLEALSEDATVNGDPKREDQEV